MNFIIAQFVGILGGIVSVGCVQFKNERILLGGQFLGNALLALNLGLLGSLSGAWICILASIQTLIIYCINKNCKESAYKNKVIVSILFAAAYLVGTIFTYRVWSDIIVCICAFLYTLTIFQKDSGKMRTVLIINMCLWVFYDFMVGAYTNILSHGFTLLSAATAKLRLDKKH